MHQGWGNLVQISINSINGRDLQVDKKNQIWHSTQMTWTLMIDLIILIIQFRKAVDLKQISSIRDMDKECLITKCNMQLWVHIDHHLDIKILHKIQDQIYHQKMFHFQMKIQKTHLALKLVLIRQTSRKLKVKSFKKTQMIHLIIEEVVTRIIIRKTI